MKRPYETPRVLRVVAMNPEGPILAGSVADKAEVTSCGQEVVDLDFSRPEFNHNWEWSE